MWIQTDLEFNFLDSGKNSTKTWSQIQGHCTEQVEDFKAERYSDPGFTPYEQAPHLSVPCFFLLFDGIMLLPSF